MRYEKGTTVTPDGRITSEFDDTAIIEQEEDDEFGDFELADLQLVVIDLELVAAGGVRAVPGAEELIRLLREAGVAVAVTTGSSRGALDRVLDALGWAELADVALSAGDAGRGRPYPDLPLTALLRTGTTSVDGMVVVGGTADDMTAGIAAGAGLVVGVLMGSDDEQTLLDAGADAVVESVADLAELLGFTDSDDLEFDDEDDEHDLHLPGPADR
jgi:phosphoglycolate phosphatase